ncbi:MAG: RnfABCDGE type electron transport complex subunit D [Eubacteriales bacterium]|nr:RnfABCDGE type electron transport complex subunit D [Eubacteriales bacterium]
MNQLLNVSTSPHIRKSINTSKIMLYVIIALLPTSIFGIMRYGIHSLYIILITIAFSVFFEWLFCIIMKKEQTINDFSAVVTGLILALNMPPNISLWVPIIGAFFAIVVIKELFGGIGQNFMNPALGARCFLLISFAGQMSNFNIDGISSATPLALERMGETTSITNLFMGFIPGTIGEVSKICLLIGAIFLLWKGIIKLRIPFFYILSFCIFIFLFGNQKFDINYIFRQVLSGGLIFGAFFMATDYATSPITPIGQIIYALLLGFLTAIFRTFSQSTEGVSYAIILGNVLYPLIESISYPKAFGREAKK